MFKKMFKILKSILLMISLSLMMQIVRADLLSDANTIFDWVEKNYSQYFSPATQTLFIDGWRYRYYSNMENYVGVNDTKDVYILGSITNNVAERVDSVANVLAFIASQETSSSNSSTTESSTSTATEGCADVPLITSGTQYDISTTENGETIVASVIHEQVNDSYSKSTVVASGATSTIEANYSIKDNIISVTKIVANTIYNGTSYETTAINSPAQKSFALQFCTGQTLQNEYEISITSSIVDFPKTKVSDEQTVDSVNESVTTPAGTFLTVKTSTTQVENGQTDKTIVWYDQDSGVIVKQLEYKSGNLESSTELTSLNLN